MKRNWHRKYTRRHIGRKKDKKGLWVVVFVIAIFGLVWAYNSGYVKIPDINFNSTKEIPSNILSVFKTNPERKKECILTFNELNNVRAGYGKKPLYWDERAYNLSVARAKDMYERNYFDHVTPEGECVYTMKKDYGFNSFEFLAENIGGMSYYSKGSVAGDCNEAVEGWLTSRGHRYNLLYSTHKGGAIGCYYEICVFLGLNNDGFGQGCNTGDEGLAFWETAPKQSGEV